MSDHDPHPPASDAKAAFTGLIFGAIALFVIVFAIHELTNRKFAGHATPAATVGH